MTFAWISNTDQRPTRPEYAADPVAAVERWYKQMEAFPLAGIHMLPGHDGALEYKAETDTVPDPVKLAVIECMRSRRALGKRNLMFTGGVNRAGTFAFPDTIAGHAFLRTHWSWAIANSLDVLIVDKATRFPEVLDFADTSAGYGVEVWAEPWPTNGDGETLTLNTARAKRMPHVCSWWAYCTFYRPRGLIAPQGARLYVIYNDWEYMHRPDHPDPRYRRPWDGTYTHTPDQIVMELADARQRGFRVGGVSELPQVQDWILSGGS